MLICTFKMHSGISINWEEKFFPMHFRVIEFTSGAKDAAQWKRIISLLYTRDHQICLRIIFLHFVWQKNLISNNFNAVCDETIWRNQSQKSMHPFHSFFFVLYHVPKSHVWPLQNHRVIKQVLFRQIPSFFFVFFFGFFASKMFYPCVSAVFTSF